MDNCLNALAESEMAKVWVPMISSLSGVTTNSLLQTGSSGDQLQASENVTTASPHVDAPSTLANPADEVQFSEPLPCGLSSNAISTAPGLPTGQLQYSQPWLGASQDEYLHPNYIDRDAEAQFGKNEMKLWRIPSLTSAIASGLPLKENFPNHQFLTWVERDCYRLGLLILAWIAWEIMARCSIISLHSLIQAAICQSTVIF